MTPDAVPIVVNGTWRVHERLGRGGFAAVWAVEHSVTGGHRALKVLEVSSKGARARFLQEARTLARVDHPNVVRVDDWVEVEIAPGEVRVGMVLERCDGTMGDWLASGRALEPIVAVLRQIAEGLAAAHAAGLVHRDLKPDNVLLKGPEDAPMAKVADFGLVRLVDAAERFTRKRGMLGTPEYAAPEQLRGDEVGPEADVWSFGALAFEALTGKLPYGGAASWSDDAVREAATRRSSGPALDVRRLRPEVPQILAELVTACLDPHPARRPPNGAAVAAWLGGCPRLPPSTETLDVEAISAPLPPPPPAAERSGAVFLLVTGGLLTAAVALAGVAVGAWVSGPEAPFSPVEPAPVTPVDPAPVEPTPVEPVLPAPQPAPTLPAPVLPQPDPEPPPLLGPSPSGTVVLHHQTPMKLCDADLRTVGGAQVENGAVRYAVMPGVYQACLAGVARSDEFRVNPGAEMHLDCVARCKVR